jgi:TonB family protein
MCRFVFAVIFSAALISSASKAQSQSSIPQLEATATKLSDPAYPPLARQARIQGAVRLHLHFHSDGTVESAEVMDGHPMLIVAAMESAKKTQFDCGGCSETTFVYVFEIRDGCRFGPHCTRLDSEESVIRQTAGYVFVSGAPSCECDPAVTLIRHRSAKCLYLWRCGRTEVIDE